MSTALPWIALVTSIALASAGCFGKSEEPGTPTSPTSPTNATPPTGGTSPTAPTPDDTPPAKPADVNQSVTLSIAPGVGNPLGLPVPGPTGTAGPVTVKDAGWKSFEVEVLATKAHGNSFTLQVLDSTGAVVGETTVAGDPSGQNVPPVATITVSATAPGDFSFLGSADVAVEASFTLTTRVTY